VKNLMQEQNHKKIIQLQMVEGSTLSNVPSLTQLIKALNCKQIGD